MIRPESNSQKIKFEEVQSLSFTVKIRFPLGIKLECVKLLFLNDKD